MILFGPLPVILWGSPEVNLICAVKEHVAFKIYIYLPHHHQHFEITQFSVQFSSQLKSMKEEITYAFKDIKNNDRWGKFI